MILIIEGVDLVGKSSAIEKIAKHYNSGFILKNSFKPKTKDNKEIYEQYITILRLIEGYETQNLIILDRFYPSQLIYSVKRGRDEMVDLYNPPTNTDEERPDLTSMPEYVEELLKSKNAKLILLTATPDELRRRYENRGEEHLTIGEVIDFKDRYDTFFEKCSLNRIRVDTMNEDWFETVKLFIDEDA